MVNGFLNVWKPTGMTSHEVVARIRHLTEREKVGHAGTLDPGAEGVLPLAVGECTRLLPFMDFNIKVYRAQVQVGTLTDSGDAQGRTVAQGSTLLPDMGQLEWTATWLKGPLWQVPPQVSALKTKGRRHYRTVREGGVVWPTPRRVHVAAIESIQLCDGGWSFVATVSSGTYIRALVRDWGYLLGMAAHLGALTRLKAGPFDEDGSSHLADIESVPTSWQCFLDPWQAYFNPRQVELNPKEASFVSHGDPKALEILRNEDPGVMGLTQGGRLLALVEGRPWRYRAVFEGGI